MANTSTRIGEAIEEEKRTGGNTKSVSGTPLKTNRISKFETLSEKELKYKINYELEGKELEEAKAVMKAKFGK